MRKLFTSLLAFTALPAIAGYVTTQMLNSNQFTVSAGFPQIVSVTFTNGGGGTSTNNGAFATNSTYAKQATNAPDGNPIASLNAVSNLVQGIVTTNATTDVRNFGAKCDGVQVPNCWATNGQVGVFSTNLNVTSADVGKYFRLSFGGTNGQQDWVSLIAKVDSPNLLELSNAPPYSVTNKMGDYGTDDSAAVMSAVNYLLTVYGGGVVTFPKGICVIADPLQDVGTWNTHYNAQIYITNRAYTSRAYSAMLTFRGAVRQDSGSAGPLDVYNDPLPGGSVIYSFLASGPNGTNYGNCFNFMAPGGPVANPGTPGEQIYPVNGVIPNFDSVFVRGCYNANIVLINAAGTPNFNSASSTFDFGFSQTAGGTIPFATFTNTCCLWLPHVYSDNHELLLNTECSYGYRGIRMGENAFLISPAVFSCPIAFDFWTAGGNHMTIEGANVQNCSTIFDLRGSLDVDLTAIINLQCGTTTNPVIINNPAQFLHGDVTIFNSSPAGTYQTNTLNCIGNGVAHGTVKMFYKDAGGTCPPVTYSDSYTKGNVYINGSEILTGGQIFEKQTTYPQHFLISSIGSRTFEFRFGADNKADCGDLTYQGSLSPSFITGPAIPQAALTWTPYGYDTTVGISNLCFAALADGSFLVWSNVVTIGGSFITMSNYAPGAIPGQVVFWNSNNVSQWSIKPGSTNFNFNY